MWCPSTFTSTKLHDWLHWISDPAHDVICETRRVFPDALYSKSITNIAIPPGLINYWVWTSDTPPKRGSEINLISPVNHSRTHLNPSFPPGATCRQISRRVDAFNFDSSNTKMLPSPIIISIPLSVLTGVKRRAAPRPPRRHHVVASKTRQRKYVNGRCEVLEK